VIRLGFAEGMLQQRAELDARIVEQLEDNERRLGIAGVERTIAGRFSALIAAAHAQAGERVVVLIDEYDKPILDNLTRPDTAREMRDGLRNLYSVIKGADAHIRFAMLTGVSKFSKVSLFSGLNNLRDITLSPEYSAICGYTEADLDQVFAPELEGLDRDEVRAWYNGYNWTGEAVYNPFDVLLLFEKRKFRPWWFETGSPRFLIDLLTERETWLPGSRPAGRPEALLSRFDVGDLPTEALLFQTGYLTIDRAEQLGALALSGCATRTWRCASAQRAARPWIRRTPGAALTDARLYRLPSAWRPTTSTALRTIITALFDASRGNGTQEPDGPLRGLLRQRLYAYLASLGLDLTPEDSSNAGRLDLAVRQQPALSVRVQGRGAHPTAAPCSRSRTAATPTSTAPRAAPMHLIGIEFSRERRSVVGFEVPGQAEGAGEVGQGRGIGAVAAGTEVEHMLKARGLVGGEVIGGGQAPAVLAMLHGEVLQVIVGIADAGVEDGLAIQRGQVVLRAGADLAQQIGEVGVTELIPVLGAEQGLHAQHVIATGNGQYIEPGDEQRGMTTEGGDLKVGHHQAGVPRECQAGGLDAHHVDAVAA
jgi:hypothetical protein